MPTDLFTDTLIHLMREVFAEETLAPEQRARIFERVTSSPIVEGMELWANPAVPFDEQSVEGTVREAGQLWLFPTFETPTSPVEIAVSPLLHG